VEARTSGLSVACYENDVDNDACSARPAFKPRSRLPKISKCFGGAKPASDSASAKPTPHAYGKVSHVYTACGQIDVFQ